MVLVYVFTVLLNHYSECTSFFLFKKKARCRTARRRPRVPCPPRVLPAALSLGLDFPSRGLGRARGPRAGCRPAGPGVPRAAAMPAQRRGRLSARFSSGIRVAKRRTTVHAVELRALSRSFSVTVNANSLGGRSPCSFILYCIF